jgi:uncharacterized protein YkwD
VTRAAHRLGRSAAVVLGLAIAASAALTTTPVIRTAHASVAAQLPTFDANLLAHINRVRVNHGLVRLTPTAGTTDVAHGWSCTMADQRSVFHNGRLADQLESHGSKQWTTYGENVASQRAGATARHLFKAYMDSPMHRANILDPTARFIGIWSKRDGHFRFNTMDFVGSGSWAYDDSYGGTRRTC